VTIILVCIAIFLVIFASGLVGLAVQHRLPEAQKSDSARVVISQISGVLSLLLSLVLGTLVGTSFAFQTTQKTELDALAAHVLELDQSLGELGPVGAIARERLKATIEDAYNAFWGSDSVDPKRLSVSVPLASQKAIKAFLGAFTPTSEEQKQALASVSTLADQITRSRLLMSLQVAGRPVSPGLVVILILWAVALFFAFGIFAKSNALVVAAMASGAACIAFALFLILELGLPYTGVFRVSPAALEEAIAHLGE
jgi:hypothetical protein